MVSCVSLSNTSPKRIQCVDALRGAVMIIMALDHVRDFTSSAAMHFAPDDLTRTTAALFLTRWITHFCAPTFMFTAGIGAYLWMQRKGRSTADLSCFLWLRGVWLVLLDVTVMRFALTFHLFEGPVLLLVLWALGASMIALGFLFRIPVRILAPLSILIILSHNAFDPIAREAVRRVGVALVCTPDQPGAFPLAGAFIVIGYPLVPWIFVMAAGFCFGQILTRPWMLRIGSGMTLGFLLLRGLNIDATRAPVRQRTVLPQLHEVPALARLSADDTWPRPARHGPARYRFRFSARNPLIVFGRVPLFFFVGHFYAAHLLAVAIARVRYGHAEFMWNPLPSMGGDLALFPPDLGLGLVVYLAWIAVVAAFYPLCLWFSRLKERRRDWWLSYL